MRMLLPVVLVVAFGLAGCGVSVPLLSGDEEMEWRGLSSAVDKHATAVARTQKDWLQLWALTGMKPPRELDVGEEVAIAIFLGTRRTGGYQPQIIRIADNDGGRTVEWRELEPPQGAAVVQVITNPWLIKVLPAADGAIRFREIRKAEL
jgi:hypothetical protein